MATTEQIEKRPACDWPINSMGPDGKPNGRTQPCGSEERVFEVKGHGKSGYPKTSKVCSKHIPNAIKEWNWDSVEPCGYPKV
jgi:hypothetical protein